eukprot:840048-Pelagomonas_calceolata.AAC.2
MVRRVLLRELKCAQASPPAPEQQQQQQQQGQNGQPLLQETPLPNSAPPVPSSPAATATAAVARIRIGGDHLNWSWTHAIMLLNVQYECIPWPPPPNSFPAQRMCGANNCHFWRNGGVPARKKP